MSAIFQFFHYCFIAIFYRKKFLKSLMILNILVDFPDGDQFHLSVHVADRERTRLA